VIDPVESLSQCSDRWHVGGLLPLDHHDLDAEVSCSNDLAIGGRPTAVLGDDDVDAIFLQEPVFVGGVERTASEDVAHMRKIEWRSDGIDAAYEIVVLRRLLEMKGFLPANCEKDVSGFGPECRHGVCHRKNERPAITRLPLPCRTPEGKRRNAGQLGGVNGIGGDARGKRVGGINQKVELIVTQKIGQTLCAAKAATARCNRLRHRFGGPAGQRQQHVAINTAFQPVRQLPGLGRSPEYQNAVSAHA
jgi:hypothetical protein